MGQLKIVAENRGTPPVIALDRVSKSFAQRSWKSTLRRREPLRIAALREVSLSVRPGEVLGLLGPNGAGKTTLIKILATLILPDAGTVTICNFDGERQGREIRRRLGLVNSSERSFYWRLTGRENLLFFAALADLRGNERSRRVQEVLAFVDLEESAEIQFMRYSAGQKQRLAIGRALLSDPQIFLLDEPTSSLDPLAAAHLRDFVRTKLADEQGKTIIWCTHDLAEAKQMSDRLVFLSKGRIVAAGKLKEIVALLEQHECFRFTVSGRSAPLLPDLGLSPAQIAHRNGYFEFDIQVKEDDVPTMLEALVRGGVRVFGCSRKDPDLSEVFQRVIG